MNWSANNDKGHLAWEDLLGRVSILIAGNNMILLDNGSSKAGGNGNSMAMAVVLELAIICQ